MVKRLPFNTELMRRIAAADIGASLEREREERLREKIAKNDEFGRGYLALQDWIGKRLNETVEGLLAVYAAPDQTPEGNEWASAHWLDGLPEVTPFMSADVDLPCLGGRVTRRTKEEDKRIYGELSSHYKTLHEADVAWGKRHAHLRESRALCRLSGSLARVWKFKLWLLNAAHVLSSYELTPG